jgi:hypothetical protein
VGDTISNWLRFAGAGTAIAIILLGSCTTEPCACPPALEGVTVVSGNQQVGSAGQALSAPIVVRAYQQIPYDDRGLSGRPLHFLPQPGSGSVGSSAVTTDADGLAEVTWTLGPDAGEDTLIVRMYSPEISPGEAIITATAIRAELALAERLDGRAMLEELSASTK